MNRSFFKGQVYERGRFEILARTPVPQLPLSYSPPPTPTPTPTARLQSIAGDTNPLAQDYLVWANTELGNVMSYKSYVNEETKSL